MYFSPQSEISIEQSLLLQATLRRTILAGVPAAIQLLGKVLLTRLPAPTILPFPIFVLYNIVDLIPIQTWSPISIFLLLHISFVELIFFWF